MQAFEKHVATRCASFERGAGRGLDQRGPAAGLPAGLQGAGPAHRASPALPPLPRRGGQARGPLRGLLPKLGARPEPRRDTPRPGSRLVREADRPHRHGERRQLRTPAAAAPEVTRLPGRACALQLTEAAAVRYRPVGRAGPPGSGPIGAAARPARRYSASRRAAAALLKNGLARQRPRCNRDSGQ